MHHFEQPDETQPQRTKLLQISGQTCCAWSVCYLAARLLISHCVYISAQLHAPRWPLTPQTTSLSHHSGFLLTKRWLFERISPDKHGRNAFLRKSNRLCLSGLSTIVRLFIAWCLWLESRSAMFETDKRYTPEAIVKMLYLKEGHKELWTMDLIHYSFTAQVMFQSNNFSIFSFLHFQFCTARHGYADLEKHTHWTCMITTWLFSVL